MHYQNALQKYFDGELDDVGEDMLFGELAHNHEARREFNEHTQLRSVMQQERSAITPPAHAAGAIFGALGYDVPPPVLQAPVAGGIAAKGGMFLKLLPYALTSLFSALVAVGIYAGFWENSFKNKREALSVTTNHTSENPESQLLKTDEKVYPKSNEIPTGQSFQYYDVHGGREEKVSTFSFKNNGAEILKEVENSEREIQTKNPSYNQIAVIATGDFKSSDFLKENSVEGKSEYRIFPKAEIEHSVFFHENPPLPGEIFSLETRAIAAQSFPENSVSSQTELFKNIAISAFYAKDEHQSFGVEFGHEQFAQNYGKLINEREWNVRQNPLLLYSGVGYRYTFSKQELFGLKILPFGQVLAGGTWIGPLGKTMLGFRVIPEERIGFMLAVEGAMLGYSVDGNWYNTKKLGLTYGVNVNF